MVRLSGYSRTRSTGQTCELSGLSLSAIRRLAGTQVRVSGILDLGNAHALHDLAIACLARGRPLIIDIQDAISADTAGAAVLLHIYAVARKSGCVLAIVHPAPAVNKMLALLQLDRILPLYPPKIPG